MNVDEYGGSETKKNNKYQADAYGIRYAMAGYPTTPEIGVPIVSIFSDSQYILQRDVTYAQSLNLANVRARYFDTTAPNRITTTVNNGASFTDNVLIILCDPAVASTYQPGSLLTFTNPNNINDLNLVSGTTNQFETNSITGTSTTAVTNYTVSYITAAGGLGTSTIQISGTSSEKEYKFKTGLEYFQVVTGMTAYDADLLAAGTQINVQPNPSLQLVTTNLLRKYILNKLQDIRYEDTDQNLRTETINPLTVNGDGWKNMGILILVRGTDPWTDKQDIKYDLSTLFGQPTNSVTVNGQYYLNVPIQPNTGNASNSWWNNYITPEGHTQSYASSSIYHEPYNFQITGTQFSAVTSDSIKYYSSLDKSRGGGWNPTSGPTLNTITSGPGVASNGTNTIKFYNTTLQGNIEGGSLIGSTSSTGNVVGALSNINARVYAPAYDKHDILISNFFRIYLF